MTRLVCALVMALTIGAPVTPALAGSASGEARVLYALLPLTPAQAREVASLLRAPDAVLVDVADGAGALLDALPGLPDALVHDVLNAPSRHLAMLHAVVGDVVELRALLTGEGRGLFRHTARALHRSATFSAAAGVVDRLLHPKNRTVRLAILLTARHYGVPLDASDLDLLRRAIDRDAPDVGQLLVRGLERLAQIYGRDALHLVLIR